MRYSITNVVAYVGVSKGHEILFNEKAASEVNDSGEDVGTVPKTVLIWANWRMSHISFISF